jgi:hypothetical protein
MPNEGKLVVKILPWVIWKPDKCAREMLGEKKPQQREPIWHFISYSNNNNNDNNNKDNNKNKNNGSSSSNGNNSSWS